MVGAPCPSPPTVRAGFPRTAVRQSSSHTMRRVRHGLAQAAAHGDEPHRRPRAVRKAFPSEPPACTSLGQGPAKTDGDAALQPAKRLAGVGVSDGVCPPRPQGMHPRHACLRPERRSSRPAILQAVPHLLLRRRGWAHGEGLLPAPGTLALHTGDADDITPLGHACDARLGAVAGPIPPLGDPLASGEHRLRASAAYQEGLIGVAVEGRTALLRRASTLPQVIHKVQGNVAVHTTWKVMSQISDTLKNSCFEIKGLQKQH